jgi:stage V sporulation protein S
MNKIIQFKEIAMSEIVTEVPLVKVSASSRAAAVAGAIAGLMREHASVNVQVIGAAAANQAVKAMVMAHDFLSQEDIEAVFIPTFVIVDIEGMSKTAIRFEVRRCYCDE